MGQFPLGDGRPPQVGWQTRNGLISLGRDSGLDTALWIIPTFNGLEVAQSLFCQPVPRPNGFEKLVAVGLRVLDKIFR